MRIVQSNRFPRLPLPRLAGRIRLLLLLLLFFVGGVACVHAEEPQPVPAFDAAALPFLEYYCFYCHSEEDAEGEFPLESFATPATDVQKNRREWLKVVARVKSGEMPPEDGEQPSDEERAELVAWLENALDQVDCSSPPDPGRVTLSRLNRAEYKNTIRDLLHVDFDPTAQFTRDDLGYGFDNIGDVLTLSPLHIEKYLAAAEKIATRAIVAPELLSEPVEKFGVRNMKGGNRIRRSARFLSSEGNIHTTMEVEQGGTYVMRAKLAATQAGNELARMAFLLDGKHVAEREVEAPQDDPQWASTLVNMDKGKQKVGIAFVNDYFNPQAEDPKRRDRNLYLAGFEIVGPIEPALQSLPPSHTSIIQHAPNQETAEGRNAEEAWRDATRKNLLSFLPRAYRRPVAPGEMAPLLDLSEMARQDGASYERSMQLVLQAVLVSPSFLFRGETDNDPDAVTGSHAITDWELANRLSYFLYSSMPDDELFSQAKAGTLRKNLRSEVQRMLKDPRSSALAANFAGQWLEFRKVNSATPDPEQFPFPRELREAIRRETELFFAEIVRKDLSILTMLDADFTFLNETLADHYGIEGIEGEEMRLVSLPADSRRGGVLTHASVLTVTSDPNRTSPVKRGKWILENLLNEPPPPPPPGVPELEDAAEASGASSLRKQMEIHRANPTCASCHNRMDPLGFALENFDAVGRWRESEGDHTIDAGGELPDGRAFSGAAGLQDILLEDADKFRRTLVEKLLTYALGRGLEYYDECAIREITARTKAGDDHFSEMVLAIVESAPFQRRRGD